MADDTQSVAHQTDCLAIVAVVAPDPLLNEALFPAVDEIRRRALVYRELAQCAIHEVARLTRELKQAHATIAVLRIELASRQIGRVA